MAGAAIDRCAGFGYETAMDAGPPHAVAIEHLDGGRGWRMIVDSARVDTPGAPGRASVTTRRAVAWGDLLRADALAQELGVDPCGPDRHEQILLAGYERWGTGVFARILGEVAIGVWQPAAASAVAATDPWGSRPVYYAQLGSKVAIATDTRALWTLPWVGDEPDDETVVAWLIDATPHDDATFYRNVKRVPGGHVLVARGGQVDVRRYWGPDFPDQGLRTRAAFEEAFRDTLFDAVRARIEGSAPVTIMLSGGFDSTAIAAVAGQLASEAGMPDVRTLSAVFPGLPCDESDRIASVRAMLPFEGDVFEPIARPITPDDVRDDVDVYDGPLVHTQRDLFDFGLRAARDRGTPVVLSGHGGDELALDWDYPADLARMGSVRGAVGSVAALHGRGTLAAIRWIARRMPPRWVRRSLWRDRLGVGSSPFAALLEPRWWFLARAMQAPPSADAARRWERPDDVRWQVFTNASGARSRAWTIFAGDRAGVRLRAPFLDRRLSELVFGARPDVIPRTVDTGLYKPIIVHATGDLLPASHVQGAWKVEFSSFGQRVLDASLERLTPWQRARPTWAATRFIGRDRASELARRCGLTGAQRPSMLGEQWFGVLGLEQWLSTHSAAEQHPADEDFEHARPAHPR